VQYDNQTQKNVGKHDAVQRKDTAIVSSPAVPVLQKQGNTAGKPNHDKISQFKTIDEFGQPKTPLNGKLLQPKPFEHSTQGKTNNTGLPDNLKSGVEKLSGFSLDDVKVSYNSDKPAQLQAFAYAQGADIHIAPGQEKHLPHEAWHVVQQKQGRVQPTMQLKDNISINNDDGLEAEADQMGEAAALAHQFKSDTLINNSSNLSTKNPSGETVQRIVSYQIDSDTDTINNVVYTRTNQPLTLNGKMHGKHATADSAQAAVFEIGLNGLKLPDALKYLKEVAESYLKMPSINLINYHQDQTGNKMYNNQNEGIPLAYKSFYEKGQDLHNLIAPISGIVMNYNYNKENDIDNGVLLYKMASLITKITTTIDDFRDLVPLVNLDSKGEIAGKEKDSKAILDPKEKELRKGIKFDDTDGDEIKVVFWQMFDMAAINMLYDIQDIEGDDDEDKYAYNIRDSLKWFDLDSMVEYYEKQIRSTEGHSEDDLNTIYKRIAAELVTVMIQNHVHQMYISYPMLAKAAKLEATTLQNIKELQKKYDHTELDDFLTDAFEDDFENYNPDDYEEEVEEKYEIKEEDMEEYSSEVKSLTTESEKMESGDEDIDNL
jgi:hypothetical protein